MLKLIRVKQNKGKYGIYTCPVCYDDEAAYKFSSGMGFCSTCKSTATLTDESLTLIQSKDTCKNPHQIDHWLELDIHE